MNDRERAQIALILQRATKFACTTVDALIKAMYADHASKGRLQSGATIKVAVDAMNDVLSTLIPEMAHRVGEVVRDKAAFGEMHVALQHVFATYHELLGGVVRVANGRGPGEAADRSVVAAAETLFSNWRTDLEAQVAILAYDFEAPPAAPEKPALPQSSADKKKGGRQPKDFWDDMWAAIGASLYNGDLKPKSQADVERAMAEWIDGHGYSASESSVRARARRLWDRISAPD